MIGLEHESMVVQIGNLKTVLKYKHHDEIKSFYASKSNPGKQKILLDFFFASKSSNGNLFPNQLRFFITFDRFILNFTWRLMKGFNISRWKFRNKFWQSKFLFAHWSVCQCLQWIHGCIHIQSSKFCLKILMKSFIKNE